MRQIDRVVRDDRSGTRSQGLQGAITRFAGDGEAHEENQADQGAEERRRTPFVFRLYRFVIAFPLSLSLSAASLAPSSGEGSDRRPIVENSSNAHLSVDVCRLAVFSRTHVRIRAHTYRAEATRGRGRRAFEGAGTKQRPVTHQRDVG